MELWKPLKNYPGYEGSTEGRIRNVRTQRVLKPGVNKKGYPHVAIIDESNSKSRTVKVHTLISETFLGERNGLDVRHLDNDKLNNHVNNLYYSTRSETIKDAFVRGSKTPSHQIPIRVMETGRVYDSITACSVDTGCDPSDIRRCLNGKLKHVKGLHFEEL